jgi:hypothetical protein
MSETAMFVRRANRHEAEKGKFLQKGLAIR